MGFIFEGIGAGLSFMGAGKEAKAQKEQGRAEKEAAYLEAAQIDANAKSTMAAATYNVGRIRKKADQILATQQAEAAARGSSLDGSVRAIAAETIREASMDQLLTMADAETSAGKDRYEAEIRRKSGRTAEKLGGRRASATLLGGWGQAASSVGKMADSAGWFT